MHVCTMFSLLDACRNSGHFSQCDGNFVMPEFFVKFVDKDLIDPTLALAVNLELCHSFLRRFLLQGKLYSRHAVLYKYTLVSELC